MAAQAFAIAAHLPLDAPGFFQQAARTLQQGLSGGGGAHATVVPLQQRRAQRGLQVGQPLAGGGGRQPAALGGAGNAAAFGGGDKDFQVAPVKTNAGIHHAHQKNTQCADCSARQGLFAALRGAKRFCPGQNIDKLRGRFYVESIAHHLARAWRMRRENRHVASAVLP
ncbi:MAG: hypothetical protein U1E47_06950 [Rivihabitans pingtungensis]